MRILVLVASFFTILAYISISASPVEALSRVKGYYKPKTGTYVQPHYRTSSNTSKFDNWSTKGNYNLFTGKKGTVDPFKSSYKSYRWKY